jgi:hypothetical protein
VFGEGTVLRHLEVSPGRGTSAAVT